MPHPQGLTNAFEAGTRRCIPSVLVYLERDRSVLLIHKGRPGDFHAGKYNGLGGKLEADESPLDSAVRETREEAGIEVPRAQFTFAGVIQFPRFKPRGRSGSPEDWVVYLWRASVTAAQAAAVRPECDEGRLEWVEWERLPEIPMWEGDALFLPRIRAGAGLRPAPGEGRGRGEPPVVGTIWYEDGRPVRHWFY